MREGIPRLVDHIKFAEDKELMDLIIGDEILVYATKVMKPTANDLH